jgi:CBS domain-containing protein
MSNLQKIGVLAVVEGASKFVSELQKATAEQEKFAAQARKTADDYNKAQQKILNSNSAGKEAAQIVDKMGDSARRLNPELVRLASEWKKQEEAVNNAAKATKGMGGALGDLGGKLLNVAKGAAVAFVSFQAFSILKNIISDTAELGSQTFVLQKQIGGTAEEVSSLLSAFARFGLEPKTVATGLGILSRNLALVQENAAGLNTRGQQSTRVLAGLGITVLGTNGKLRPTVEILKDLADKFSRTGDEGLKLGIASQLFGEQFGRQVLPFLDQGSKGIEQLQARAKELGLTFTDEGARSAFEFSVAQRELQETLSQLKVTIGQELLPVVKEFAETLADFLSKNREGIKSFARTAVGDFKDFVAGIGVAFDLVKKFLGFLPDNQGSVIAAVGAIAIALNLAFGIGSPWLVGLGLGLTLLGKIEKSGIDTPLGKFGGQQNTQTGERNLFGRPSVQGEVASLLKGQSFSDKALSRVTPGFLQSDEFKDAEKVVERLKKAGITQLEQFNQLSDEELEKFGAITKQELEDRQKSKQALDKNSEAAQQDGLSLNGITDAMKRQIEKAQELAQAFAQSSEAAGKIETVASKLKLFGEVSKELADNRGLSAVQAGNIQGVDAVIAAQKRAEAESYNFASTLATVAQAFQQSAQVAQNIVLQLARSALDAERAAASAIFARPTREVADQNVRSAKQDLILAQIHEKMNPILDVLKRQLAAFSTRGIDAQIRGLDRQARQVERAFQQQRRAAEQAKKARERQVDLAQQAVDALKLANLRAQVAYERQNAALEKLIDNTKKAASDLQAAFLASNEDLQRQINAAIGKGDTAGALSLVEQQKRQTAAYRASAKALQTQEEQLTTQQKQLKEANDERQRQAQLAEAEAEAQQKKIESDNKAADSSDDLSSAEEDAKNSIDDQKQALEDQKQSILDSKQATQDNIDAIQAGIDAEEEKANRIKEQTGVLQAESNLQKALLEAADHTLLTQDQQRQASEALATQIGLTSQAVVDMAAATHTNLIPEITEAGRQFGIFSGALGVITDQDLRNKFIDGGIDPAAERLAVLATAAEPAADAIRRMTLEAVTAADSLQDVFRNLADNFPHFDIGGFTPASGGAFPAVLHPNELVLPLNNPTRMAQLLESYGASGGSAGGFSQLSSAPPGGGFQASTGPGGGGGGGLSPIGGGSSYGFTLNALRQAQELSGIGSVSGYSAGGSSGTFSLNVPRGSGGGGGNKAPGGGGGGNMMFSMAQVPASVVASQIAGKGGDGRILSMPISVKGESLETMETMALSAVRAAFRDARSVSNRSGSLLSSGIGATG